MLEIEIKARIAHLDEIRKRLEPLATYQRAIDRRDSYYTIETAGGRHTFRLRREDAETRCTIKQRSLSAGVEINQEMEFKIADPDNFLHFMRQLGARPLARKYKVGESWRWRSYTVELVMVKDVGCFIEIEYLVDAAKLSEQRQQAVERDFYELLTLLNIEKSHIEPRRYLEMLATDGSAPP